MKSSNNIFSNFLRVTLTAALSFTLIGFAPSPASAWTTSDPARSLPDGRAYGVFAQLQAKTTFVSSVEMDDDKFLTASVSDDGKVIVAAGYNSTPLLYGVYGWTEVDTDWESRGEFDFYLKGNEAGTTQFYYAKVSADGSTVVGRADDGIYIWEKPVAGWDGLQLPTVVIPNNLQNPNYSIGFYGVGAAGSEKRIEIAGDGSFLALGADFSRSNATPVIILNRDGASWTGFDTANTGYVRIEAPLIETENYWGADMSVNPVKNEIAIKYKKDEIFIYNNLGQMQEVFTAGSAFMNLGGTAEFNRGFSLVGDTLVVNPSVTNTSLLKEVWIYSRTNGAWDVSNPYIWDATGLTNVTQNTIYGDAILLSDENMIALNGSNAMGGLLIQRVEGGWESLTTNPMTFSVSLESAYYESDGDVAFVGSGNKLTISHPASKPLPFKSFKMSSTSMKFNSDYVPAIRIDIEIDPTDTEAIWYGGFVVVDGNNSAIASVGPSGGVIANSNAGSFVAGQTYNICVYPYTYAAFNGLYGEPFCNDVTPGAPSAPTIFELKPLDGALVVSIYPLAEAPTTSPVTKYEYSLDGGLTWSDLEYVNFQYKISGLTNGTAESVQVRGVNAIGGGAASDAVTGTPNPPTPASNVVAVAGSASAAVTFDAGTGASSYKVVADPGGQSCTASTSLRSCTVYGLTNGTAYTFVVQSLDNTNSVIATSVASEAVTPSGGGGGGSAPSAPTGVSASSGDGRATVSWSAVSGATSYIVTSNPGGLTCTTSNTSCAVTGLTNGTEYTFTVRASNANGTSGASNASNSVTPVESDNGGGGDGNGSDEGFVNDPNLEYTAPTSPALPGAAIATNGGQEVPTDQKKFGSSSAIKVIIGGSNPSTATVRALLNGTKSPLPLRKVNGIKSLAPEQRSEMKIKLGGYKKGSQVQIYLNNLDTNEAVFLGYARVRPDGTVVKKFRLPAGLNPGAYNLQVNGYGAKTDAIRVNKLSIGTYLVEKALDRVYFDADSSALNDAAKSGLENVLPQLQGASQVYIYSYTTGDPGAAFKKANDKLASKRAKRVKRFLVASGIDANSIVIITVGAVLPRDRSQPWQNRRIDIYADQDR